MPEMPSEAILMPFQRRKTNLAITAIDRNYICTYASFEILQENIPCQDTILSVMGDHESDAETNMDFETLPRDTFQLTRLRSVQPVAYLVYPFREVPLHTIQSEDCNALETISNNSLDFLLM